MEQNERIDSGAGEPVLACKRRKHLRLAALAVCCALLGGIAGGAATGLLLQGRERAAMRPAGQQTAVSGGESTGAEPSAARVASTAGELTPTQLYEHYAPCVVGVLNLSAVTDLYGKDTMQASTGSGVLLTGDGEILTNYHVVKDCTQLTVTLYDGTEHTAKLLGYEEDSDIALLKIDGSYIRAYITRVEMGGIFGTIVLLVDVTYNVKAEKMRQEFTANVSHELKTPLTTIKGFGEMFGSGMITKEDDVAKYGAMIERESERLLFLINDIIRLSEIEEHTEMLNTPVDLAAAAGNALQILEPQIQRNRIQVHLEGRCLLLHSNEGYMRELFINLIDNAIKYNNPGGTVSITIEHVGTQAKIVIADNGIGIPLQAQSRIFERFYRVDKSRSKQRGGTGLGLSIVKHIVDCHNGTISLRSELGHGTEITLLLPEK